MLLQRPATVYDARTGFRFRPGWAGRFYYAGGRDFVLVRVNSHGFISPEYPEPKPAGTVRVALLGDSMFTGLQVEADSRARALVEGALATAAPAEVLNFGLPGTGPVTSLGVYREFARAFDPDVVVVGIYTDNDFMDDADTPWRDDRGELTRAPFAASPGNVGKMLKANSCVVMAAWTLANGRSEPEGRESAAPIDATTLASKPTFELARVPEPAFRKANEVWDELIREIRADGVRVVIVLFPDHATYEGERWDYARPATKLLHRRLAEDFAARGVPVVSGADILARHTARVGAAPLQLWKSYLSREGHQTLAELLVERIREVLPARMAASVRWLRDRACARRVIANLRSEVDDVVYVEAPEPFHAVGRFYDDFEQTSDAEVEHLLDDANRAHATAATAPTTSQD